MSTRYEKIGVVTVTLLLSILAHLAAIPCILEALKHEPSLEKNKKILTKMKLVSLLQDKKPEKKNKKKKDEKGQFVSLKAPEKEELPDKAKFLDQFNSKTEKETLKKESRGDGGQPSVKQKPDLQKDQKNKPKKKKTAAQKKQKDHKKDQKKNKELEVKQDDIKNKWLQAEETGEQSESEIPSSDSEVPNSLMVPNFENTRAVNGGTGVIDYLKDIDEGDKTLLNRKRSTHWAFFDKVKRSISHHWHPAKEYRSRDPFGQVYGIEDRLTVLDVTLKNDGSLHTYKIITPSGLKFMDKEAIKAVKYAQPFPNPPAGLLNEDGLLHFSFGFYFEISSSSFQLFRYK